MNIEAAFHGAFGKPPHISRFTPGRVNLIGEHTDYNGGAVLPTVLELGLHIAISLRDDDSVMISSDGFEDRVERRLHEPARGHWADYAVGAVEQAYKAGWLSHGLNISLMTNLPMGAGLSSSSALIVGILKLVRDVKNTSVSDPDLALLAQKVETDYIGMPCGIMDQMAIAIARPGEALFLDTKTLDYETIELPADPAIAILHSGVRRALADGRYKERKEECDQVKAILDRHDICRADPNDIQSVTEPLLHRRARHCVTEHQRTLDAAEFLRRRDYAPIGKLMTESHASMRDDFEITTPEIDALVQSCIAQGAYGARMTGGGFGGCIVALVPRASLIPWRDAVLSQHPEAFHVA